MKLITWNIYEISSMQPLHNIKLRGTIRKFCIENEINCLVENATDRENTVRFALVSEDDFIKVKTFLDTLTLELNILLVNETICNPVLSKLKVNNIDRY